MLASFSGAIRCSSGQMQESFQADLIEFYGTLRFFFSALSEMVVVPNQIPHTGRIFINTNKVAFNCNTVCGIVWVKMSVVLLLVSIFTGVNSIQSTSTWWIVQVKEVKSSLLKHSHPLKVLCSNSFSTPRGRRCAIQDQILDRKPSIIHCMLVVLQ